MTCSAWAGRRWGSVEKVVGYRYAPIGGGSSARTAPEPDVGVRCLSSEPVAFRTSLLSPGKRYAVREDLTPVAPANCPKAVIRFLPTSSQICACQDPIRRNANGMGQWDCSSLHAQAIH